MNGLLHALEVQRYDDHRYYHHSTVNQTLHLVSACCFVASYLLVFTDPVAAVILGWVFAMTSRQIGHFFFEPKGYDEVNAATHAHKEAIKIGYNLRRKAVLMALWGAAPLVLVADPSLFGAFEPYADASGFTRHVAILWLWLAGGALAVRSAQLCLVKDVQTGVVWLLKILTDPFHDIKLYHKAPLHLLRGRLIDPESPASR